MGSGGRKSPSGVQGQSPGKGSGGLKADAFLLLNA